MFRRGRCGRDFSSRIAVWNRDCSRSSSAGGGSAGKASRDRTPLSIRSPLSTSPDRLGSDSDPVDRFAKRARDRRMEGLDAGERACVVPDPATRFDFVSVPDSGIQALFGWLSSGDSEERSAYSGLSSSRSSRPRSGEAPGPFSDGVRNLRCPSNGIDSRFNDFEGQRSFRSASMKSRRAGAMKQVSRNSAR